MFGGGGVARVTRRFPAAKPVQSKVSFHVMCRTGRYDSIVLCMNATDFQVIFMYPPPPPRATALLQRARARLANEVCPAVL